MILNTDSILNQFGGYKPNDLNEKLSLYDEETNEIPIRKTKDYVYGIWLYNALGIWKGYYRVKKIIGFIHETVNRGKK